MAAGPGKYDDLCTFVRQQTEAEMVLLIIHGGNKGPGFSAQFAAPPGVTSYNPAAAALLHASILRDVAAQLEADAANLPKDGVGAYVTVEPVQTSPTEQQRIDALKGTGDGEA